MVKETETTEKSIKKNPYAIRSLIWKWAVALLLMLLVFPLLADVLGSFIPWLPGNLTYPLASIVYFIYMVVWTVRFFSKRNDSTDK